MPYSLYDQKPSAAPAPRANLLQGLSLTGGADPQPINYNPLAELP